MDTCSLQGEIVVELVVPAATDEVLVAVANQETTRPLMRYGSNTQTQRSRWPIGSRETVTMQKTGFRMRG
jgi:hypothetical protein